MFTRRVRNVGMCITSIGVCMYVCMYMCVFVKGGWVKKCTSVTKHYQQSLPNIT